MRVRNPKEDFQPQIEAILEYGKLHFRSSDVFFEKVVGYNYPLSIDTFVMSLEEDMILILDDLSRISDSVFHIFRFLTTLHLSKINLHILSPFLISNYHDINDS